MLYKRKLGFLASLLDDHVSTRILAAEVRRTHTWAHSQLADRLTKPSLTFHQKLSQDPLQHGLPHQYPPEERDNKLLSFQNFTITCSLKHSLTFQGFLQLRTPPLLKTSTQTNSCKETEQSLFLSTNMYAFSMKLDFHICVAATFFLFI